jgi:hypothetical protein
MLQNDAYSGLHRLLAWLTAEVLAMRSMPDSTNSNAGAASAGPVAAPAVMQSVVVENPPSLDKDGNEVRVP